MQPTEEHWRRVAEFPLYEVSDRGRVRSWHSTLPRMRKPVMGSHGYLSILLYANGRRKTFTVHRLVMEAFVGPRPSPETDIAHYNGNKLDNRLINLRYATKTENSADSVRHGTRVRGERTPWSKLTSSDVIAIRKLRAEGHSYLQIARRFGVQKFCVVSIIHGRSWAWLQNSGEVN